jgi:hypothetical protein
VGKEQAGRSRENAKTRRWGWSGADKIVPPLWSEAELLRIIGLLPSPQSPVENILAELQALGGRYHRYLHQDEFGPTRAERMQALRDTIVSLSELSSRFESLPPQLRLLLSEKLLKYHLATEQRDLDLVEFYSADKAVIDAALESASDVQQTLLGGDRTDDAKLIEEVCLAAGATAALLEYLDTTAEADIVLDAGSASPLPTTNSADPFITVSVAIKRLRSRLEFALSHLARRKGPEARSSLVFLVWQLCDLWRRETGRPVTANPVRKGIYTGRPQSASGCFVCEAVEALQPTAAWIGERESAEAHSRTATITGARGFRVQAVHSAMRGYLAADQTDSAARRRGRPRKK